MAIRCNNCGAPVPAPTEDAGYASCTYCGTAVALPPRRAPKQSHSVSRTVAAAPAPERSARPSAFSLPVVIGVLVAGGSLAAVLAENLGAGAVSKITDAAKVGAPQVLIRQDETRVVQEPTPKTAEQRTAGTGLDPRSPNPARTRDARGAPKPAAKPTASSALVPPSPAAPPSPAPTPSPPAPAPAPKNARASIGNITTSGPRSLAEITKKLRGITGQVQACYAKHLQEKPTEAGTLSMSFQISGGQVRGAGARNPIFTGNLVGCVNRSFYTMSYADD
ncbi:MAG TPA: hypothetical protein VGK73_28405, partial [Polyangiaceae bacterium]